MEKQDRMLNLLDAGQRVKLLYSTKYSSTGGHPSRQCAVGRGVVGALKGHLRLVTFPLIPAPPTNCPYHHPSSH